MARAVMDPHLLQHRSARKSASRRRRDSGITRRERSYLLYFSTLRVLEPLCRMV
ncbi:MAG: hypothetical protein ACXVIO_14415 [Candidatus Angelobacter sp.]